MNEMPLQVPYPLRMIETIGCTQADGERLADVMQMLGVLLLQEHPFIQLDGVERVVVAIDYPAALQRHCARARVFCSNFLEVAHAAEGVTFPTEHGAVVLVRGEALLKALRDDEADMSGVARIVVHELCHAHDLARRRTWLLRAAARRGPDFASADGYWLCNAIWSEYFANRYSYFCAPRLDDERVRFRATFEGLQRLSADAAMSHLANLFGYALGSLSAAGARLEDLGGDVPGQLRVHGLWAAWVEAHTVTAALAQSGECWDDEAGVQRLMTAAHLIANACRA